MERYGRDQEVWLKLKGEVGWKSVIVIEWCSCTYLKTKIWELLISTKFYPHRVKSECEKMCKVSVQLCLLLAIVDYHKSCLVELYNKWRVSKANFTWPIFISYNVGSFHTRTALDSQHLSWRGSSKSWLCYDWFIILWLMIVMSDDVIPFCTWLRILVMCFMHMTCSSIWLVMWVLIG